MSILSILRCAQLCKAIYNPITPQTFTRTWQVGGISFGYCAQDGVAAFNFAGSEVGEDWLRNFTAIKYEHPVLGTLHLGFWEGMQDLFDAVQGELVTGNKIVVTGHSLGAAHAQIFSGLCAAAGIEMELVVLFAPPRAGMSTLKNLVQSKIVEKHAYRNLQDPVPEVPVYIPIFESWQDMIQLEAMAEPPAEEPGIVGVLGKVFREHSMDLYLRGAEKIVG
jgi:hypothetical protein